MNADELNAHVKKLVDQAPLLSADRRHAIGLLLTPQHDEGAARQPRPRPLNATPPAAKLVGGCDARR
jgi:hypothetical protein